MQDNQELGVTHIRPFQDTWHQVFRPLVIAPSICTIKTHHLACFGKTDCRNDRQKVRHGRHFSTPVDGQLHQPIAPFKAGLWTITPEQTKPCNSQDDYDHSDNCHAGALQLCHRHARLISRLLALQSLALEMDQQRPVLLRLLGAWYILMTLQ